MKPRVARNQVFVLRPQYVDLLRRLHSMAAENKFLPILTDLVDVRDLRGYMRTLMRLRKLEEKNWIVIHRVRNRIRAIEVLALP